MLILTRRIGEQLLIGNDIKVVVLSIKSNQIRIGIDALDDVKIMREEFLDPPTPDSGPLKLCIGKVGKLVGALVYVRQEKWEIRSGKTNPPGQVSDQGRCTSG